MDESKGLRERSEEPTFINLDEEENESFKALWRIRQTYYNLEKDAEREMKEYAETRKIHDAEILSALEDSKDDGLVWKGTLLDRVYNKGRESWDANYLRKVLTPEQLTTAKKQGTPYVYLKTTSIKD